MALRRAHAELVGTVLFVADFFTVCLSFFLGFHFYDKVSLPLLGLGKGTQSGDLWFFLTIAIGGLFVLLFSVLGLYETEASVLNIQETRRLLQALLLGSMLLLSLTFYLREIELSRLITTYSLGFAVVLLFAQRFLLNKLHARILSRGRGARRVIIYGAGETGIHLMRRIDQTPRLGYRLVGFLDDDPSLQGNGGIKVTPGLERSYPVLGTGESVRKAVVESGARQVFLAATHMSSEQVREVMRRCEDLGVECAFVPGMHQLTIHNLALDELGGVPLLRLKREPRRLLYPALKRAFDAAFSLAVIALTGPAWLLIAWLIRRDSPGPALFVHERVGLGGRVFRMYKFRTMRAGTAPQAPTPKTRDDGRITRIGRWLRRTSLDELPQFLNVLKGEMSVVGPRPEMPFIVERYSDLQRRRLEVKPGITGLWQISADRAVEIHDNIEYDLYYIENRSFLLDLSILAETVYFAVRGVGAF